MPYAAKAIIQHEFVVNLLNIYIEFRHPMDITVKPADTLWIVDLDGVPTAISSSAWHDQFTMKLVISPVAAEPDRVTVQYDGPDPLLLTAWDKQWEPWAAITSFSGWPTTFKYGMIILWHGSVVSIPTGWHLCDGTVGTPDLRNKFIVGAGSTYNPAATGGNLTHTHAATQAAHSHSLAAGFFITATGGPYFNTTDSKTPVITVPSTNHLPPYYALCYIMKL
jgi:hypothetical protein